MADTLERTADGCTATQQIAAFMRRASLEATYPTAADVASLCGALPTGGPVYLSTVPTHDPDDVIEPAVRLRSVGFEPVPHIAARRLRSAVELDRLLSRLRSEAGIGRVLIIGGDRERPAGPFASGLELIESGLLQRHGIAEIGIAGYPEGHPRLSGEALDRALAAKIEAAEQTGLAIHIVTQFGFNAAAMLGWITTLRDRGIEHPVRIGMAGPTRLSTLLGYARRCGVRASAQEVTRQGGLIKHLIGSNAPDDIVRALAEADSSGRYGQIIPHVYSFGGLGATARWTARVSAGRIALDNAGGFSVEPA